MSDLISKNWDYALAKYTWEEIRGKCLFAVIWGEKKGGGYNMSDFEPFIALKRVLNQGVEAYEGLRLGTTMDEISEGKMIRRVQVSGRSYTPISFLTEADRMTIVKDPNEILQPFLDRWNTDNQKQ